MTAAKLGIIGAGNMGSAIIRGVLRAGIFAPNEIGACDVIQEKAQTLSQELHITAFATVAQLMAATDSVILAVKPQTMKECLAEVYDSLKPADLIISIAAGISTAFIEERLPKGTRVIRAMPNTPALVGAGATALCAGSNAGDSDLAVAERIFAGIGKVYRFPENLMNAVTAISGSGPAYVFYFIESLLEAGLKEGLPKEAAVDLVAQTLYGASKLLLESGEEASVLRAKVTSPGGTTEAALETMDKRGFKETIAAAIESAVNRGRELGG
ncbi:MAG: pyrroline-5-carboxylate reductase [Candidatus Abyssobacteria bacterium SURF_5]|uniref:Pyrroline-5-carboxylate reductase n=1 Tax=Abyssobacteria bacterium (strain SURF_5) TaxID=2093360 RepID=A0A3A4NDY9_ABYX5|nr:MAG: pyrroline-5-carboxylate reductase [Candidatus Abyssubacteria bacterium SURF_5]